MGILASLPVALWVVLAALLLFCAALVVRFTFALIGQIRSLRAGLKGANARLSGALGEVRETAARAQDLRAAITNHRKRR